MAILNGKHVEDSMITPEKHRFVGAFRHPFNPTYGPAMKDMATFGYCPVCRRSIMSSDGWHHFNCWQAGHFDEAQYVDIEAPACQK